MSHSVNMAHLLSRAETKAYVGFSWAYLFLGCLEALRRGEREVAVLHALMTVLTLGLWQVVHAFSYNRMHAQRLLDKGYAVADTSDLGQQAMFLWRVERRNHRVASVS